MRHSDVTMSLEVYARDLPEQTFETVALVEREVLALAAAA